MTRQFSITRPHQNYTVNKTLVLQHLEQNARIGASKARLEQFKKTELISPEESKEILKRAHARISEIIIYFIVWCKDDEKYMTVGISSSSHIRTNTAPDGRLLTLLALLLWAE